ncbi:MAG: DUF1800 domain-containing protein [Phycisphaerales bacterium]|nr:DUF1800 domain-containing protein [Planctomycetota bacterium]
MAEPTVAKTTPDSPAPIPSAPAAPAKRTPERSSSMSPIAPKDFGYEQARHLLWRAGFGGTPAQIQTLASWGPQKAVDYVLDPGNAPEDKPRSDLFDKNIMREPTAEERKAQLAARQRQDEDALAKFRIDQQRRQGQDRQQIGEVQRWWLKRMIETPRPLDEKMVLFWHGHFATSYRTIENSYHMFMQNELFRRHALGNFGDLLYGIIRDPAMLKYLNNDTSRKGHANENLAREIMELFSLGIGGYSENDIKEGARALTGYTFKDDDFVFDKNNHDAGSKTILGKTGTFDGEAFVKIILEQPGVSRLITRKLYHFFCAELPPLERAGYDQLPAPQQSALRDLASTFSGSRYAIKPVLRRLFLSQHFYDPRNMNEQIKCPVELVVGAVRSLDTPVRDLSILNDALDLMGQNLLFPPSVKGWDGGRSWINTSTMFVRQNILAFLLTGKKPRGYDANASDMNYDPLPLLDELAKASPGSEKDPGAVAEYMLRLTIGDAPSAATKQLTSLADTTGGSVTKELVIGYLLLITAMPEYQLC